jgi:polyphosphate kinase
MSNPGQRKILSQGDQVSHPEQPGAISLDDPGLFIDRDTSFLEFQRRVLEEAMDESNPLLERVKFLSILSSNLDEFYMVRVSALREQVAAEVIELDGGDTPAARLEQVSDTLRLLMAEARQHLHDKLIPALANASIRLFNYSDLTAAERAAVDEYFAAMVLPVLTPLGFDPRRPFARISNLSLNLAVLIRDRKGIERFAMLEVPQTIPQFVPVNCARKTSSAGAYTLEHGYVLLEQVISGNLHSLFPEVEILHAHPFRVTRDAEINVEETDAAGLLDRVEREVQRRHFGSVNRLGLADGMPEHLVDVLMENLKVDRRDTYRARRPLALNRFIELSRIDRPDLHDPPLAPRVPLALAAKKSVFAAIRENDILLHHPYDSFQPVVHLIEQAAHDPDVLAIKMTLYRVGSQSPLVKALVDAKRNGKQVTAVVELRARFDEESNIKWSRALEESGAHIVYGLVDLKVHCKLALVVRREGRQIQRYVHLGTGNYNPATARVYTDLGLFSIDSDLAADVSDVFNFLTGYSAVSGFRKLLVGPINLRDKLKALIRREIEHGSSGRLIFKMNALIDDKIIRLLYQASQAGVEIDLIVRGICCLRPGIPGVSENIRVRSVVGRFLEHGRIYYFGNGGNEEVYIGSADLMPRNLDRRVEALCPIRNDLLKLRLRDEILGSYLADNVKARQLMSDGRYVRKSRGPGEPAVNSQQRLLMRKA